MPSDSFPGTLAMVTGGSPRSTGVYYDVTWDNDLSPAGSDCSTRGALVPFNEGVNRDSNAGSTAADINPAKLPRDPENGCTPVYPHQFLNVNTIYEVAHAAGLRTAVSDKHPSYEILNGPSGTGIDDFYPPEINAAKKDIAKIMPASTRKRSTSRWSWWILAESQERSPVPYRCGRSRRPSCTLSSSRPGISIPFASRTPGSCPTRTTIAATTTGPMRAEVSGADSP